MFDRPPKPEEMPWIVPYLTVPDVSAALEFYEKAFGFERSVEVPGPSGSIDHAEMTWQTGRIMLGPESEEHTSRSPMTTGVPAPIALYVYTDDLLMRYENSLAAGAETIEEPEIKFWGDRVAIVADPYGYKWTFAQNLVDHDPMVHTR